MVASLMLFAPLCVEWIYSKLFMGPPYFKEEKLRLVFYVHDKDKLNSTSLITQFANSPSGLSRGRASKCERESVCGGTVYGHLATNEIATNKSISHTMF